MIKLKNIGISYGSQEVLRDCSLSLRSGERAALMGPSGCGKTTLLLCIAGLKKPQHGEVSGDFKKVSYAFQEPRLLPWLTSAQNLNVVLSDSAKTMDKAMEMLARLQLSEAANKYPSELSGGMRQRLAIGRALLYKSDVLLLDEPLKGLDKDLREDIAALIVEKSQNRSVLMVSHSASEVALITNTIYEYDNLSFVKRG